jgi:hypothetical protein
MDAPPAIRISSERTEAKTGRLMKKRENMDDLDGRLSDGMSGARNFPGHRAAGGIQTAVGAGSRLRFRNRIR